MAGSPGLEYQAIYVTTLGPVERTVRRVVDVYLGENENDGTNKSEKEKRECNR